MVAPILAKAMDISLPMPEVAPVMKQTLPFMSMMSAAIDALRRELGHDDKNLSISWIASIVDGSFEVMLRVTMISGDSLILLSLIFERTEWVRPILAPITDRSGNIRK